MRIFVKPILWLLTVALLARVIVCGINQTDEPLSEEAQALLKLRKPPDLGDKNGFAAFAAIREPRPDAGLHSKCRRDIFACLRAPEIRALPAKHASFAAEYRAL